MFTLDFDLISVEETWLSDSLKPLVELDGYTLLTKHKSNRKEGGGIGMYIKNDINFIERNDLSCPDEFKNKFDYLNFLLFLNRYTITSQFGINPLFFRYKFHKMKFLNSAIFYFLLCTLELLVANLNIYRLI